MPLPITPMFVLASTSPYRKALLASLGIPFDQADPDVLEMDLPGESAPVRAMRLAEAKAMAVWGRYSGQTAVIIASDQVAHSEATTLHKPGNFENAFSQLTSVSGRWVTFTTAVCLLYGQSDVLCRYEEFEVKFRELDDEEIATYLTREQPWDCAGSLKAESLGIALLDDTRGRDINTLFGLPLMLLNDMLREIGFNVMKTFK